MKCPNICLRQFPPTCKECLRFSMAQTMDEEFQAQVKQKFARMIQAEIDKCPLFPELIPDITYYWKSMQTRKTYKLARHSFVTGKTTYRFFNELLKLQKNEYKMAHIDVIATELQLKRASQLQYASTIGFDITWKDYRRWHLY